MSETNDNNPVGRLIAEHPFCRELQPQHLKILTEAAMLKEYQAGEVLFKEGDPANRFYIILSGEVVLESDAKDKNPVLLQSIGASDVLGWSWLFPPYYWHFAARAATDVKAIFFYGTWLRESCERDHDFGYLMLKRMSEIVIQRLQTARKRLVQLETSPR